MSDPGPLTCLKCRSKQVITGSLGGANFTPKHYVFLKLVADSKPYTSLEGEVFACLSCGLIWSQVDLSHLQKSVQDWGPEKLKRQVLLWQEQETPEKILLRPAQAGEEAESSSLLRSSGVAGAEELTRSDLPDEED